MTRPTALLALALAGCAAASPPVPPTAAPGPAAAAAPVPPPPAALALRNAGFDADMPADRRCAPAWDCTMHNNPGAFRFFLQDGSSAGGRSLCVERVAEEPWALVTQALWGAQIQGRRLRLSMAVRVEGASGRGAGPWALVQGTNPPLNPQRLVSGTTGWERLAIDFSVPATAQVLEVGATLDGPGKACFDDVRLEVLPPS